MDNHSAYRSFREQLLPLIRCPVCSSDKLSLINGEYEGELCFRPLSEYLRCAECGVEYPITEDAIPVMWSARLKRALEGGSEGESNIGANVSIYEEISNSYLAHSRNYPDIARRMQNVARRILGEADGCWKYHLDFGCGRGHVLGWLKREGLVQAGLDVSLKNLRSARERTGALVVCGDAAKMPFREEVFDLVTESSALHHIEDWQAVVAESCRVCKSGGGIVLDSEPSRGQKDYGALAKIAYHSRFPVYKVLSWFQPKKYVFRSMRRALLNQKAEIHAQPGRGFPPEEVGEIMRRGGMDAEIIHWADENLQCRPRPGQKSVLLSILSFRNPYNPKYGPFTAVGRKR